MRSRRAWIIRGRRVAAAALDAYPIAATGLDFVAHAENTTFRVNTADGRYLLRVHRPRRHGRDVDPVAAVRSELEWLIALRDGSGVRVPEPVRTRGGELTVTAGAGDAARTCSLLRWVDGIIHEQNPRPVHLRRIGDAMARLHDHTETWTPPPGFVRIRWDWETFFGDTMVYGDRPAAEVWPLLPAPVRRRFDRVAERAAGVMAALGEGPDAFGLIHADLHTGNAVFTGDRVALIDFDDSGYGHRVYDLAVALWELRTRPDYPAYRDALLAGYRAHRHLPDDQLALIDDFIAIREVAFCLWYTGTAQVDPSFAEDLDETLEYAVNSIDSLLPATATPR